MLGKDTDPISREAAREYCRALCPDDYVTDLLEVIRDYLQADLPLYSDSLIAAFREVEPVFAGERYAEFFWHCASTVPGWIARVALTNGKAESEGSEKLFDLWQHVDYDPNAEEQVLAHAKDEARHSRIFVALTQRAFPDSFSDEYLTRFEAALPDVRKAEQVKAEGRIPEDHLIDHLVQMNIGEIRTRLHMHLFAPVIFGMAPPANKLAVRRLLEGLVRDEVRHIGYTARLMEDWARDGAEDLIRRLYASRLRTFNRITYEQTASAVHQYGQGRFPDLVEI